MATNKFITNTASLKTTVADIRKLDTKKINAQTIFLDGENIRDIINNATPTIKHSQDTRETVTENDIWGQWVETTEDGTIIVHDDWVTNPKAYNGNAWNGHITKVEDNKAYVGDTMWANIQTEKINDGSYMFMYCSDMKSFDVDLPSLTNGNHMFAFCRNLTTFNSNLPSLTNGNRMFSDSFLESFSSDLFSLTDGEWMFYSCSHLSSFITDLSHLKNGREMFSNCGALTSFDVDLPSLTDGAHMFNYCSNLKTFDSDLSNLIISDNMFSNSAIETFDSNLPNLLNGGYMFLYCTHLKSFNSDLTNLTNGYSMFDKCENLTSVNADLASLICGHGMFSECNLDSQSVMFIADSINDIAFEKQQYTNSDVPYVTITNNGPSASKGFMSNGDYVYTYATSYSGVPQRQYGIVSLGNVAKLSLSINVTNNSSTIQQQLEDFAKEATFDTWNELKQVFIDKGWTVTFQYGGSTTSITYGLRDTEQIIPCPIFAKLIESDKEHAKYCTEDASSFYNIEWGHDVTDATDYTQFNSLEDAAASWNVFPKENMITEEEA